MVHITFLEHVYVQSSVNVQQKIDILHDMSASSHLPTISIYDKGGVQSFTKWPGSVSPSGAVTGPRGFPDECGVGASLGRLGDAEVAKVQSTSYVDSLI